MSSRISLITILLICWNGKTAGAAVDWAADTCQISILENEPKENLYTFTAPEGTHTDYTYAIKAQNVSDRFSIDTNGVLRSDTDLDFESDEKSYSVKIIATHTPEDTSKNGDVTCEIRVTDVNDVGPEFVKKLYNVDTVNNVAKDTNLLTVSATDGDMSSVFNKVVYSIKDGGNGVNFTVDVNTGVISAKTILAAADPVNLTLTVVAKDNNTTTFTDDALVTVCLGCKTSGSAAPEISLFASMALVFSVVLM